MASAVAGFQTSFVTCTVLCGAGGFLPALASGSVFFCLENLGVALQGLKCLITLSALVLGEALLGTTLFFFHENKLRECICRNPFLWRSGIALGHGMSLQLRRA